MVEATGGWWGGGGGKGVESRRTQMEESGSRGKEVRAESGSCGCTGSPVWFPEQTGTIFLTGRQMPHTTSHPPYGRVCSSGRPEKWISWGALVQRSSFRQEPFLSGASPSAEPSTSANATHRYFRVSRNYKEIRLLQSVREQGLLYRRGGLLKATEMSIVNPRAPPFRNDSRIVNERYCTARLRSFMHPGDFSS